MSAYRIEIANQHTEAQVNESRLREAVRQILKDEQVSRALISVAIVGDEKIHQLNAKYLDHDHPTDALSFVLDFHDGFLEGEIVVSADTAVDRAQEFGWTADDELLLYVIHGALHLVGYDDADAESTARMRRREEHYLSLFQLRPIYDDRVSPAAIDGPNPTMRSTLTNQAKNHMTPSEGMNKQ